MQRKLKLRRRWGHCLLRVVYYSSLVCFGGSALARPPGPTTLCEVWPEAEPCPGATSCEACHTTPPARDLFGQAIEEMLWPGAERPESDDAFAEGLLSALPGLAELDSDGDGYTNRAEWVAGSDPGDADSAPAQVPTDDPCRGGGANPDFKVCEYDTAFAYRRASIDLCGRSPQWEALNDLRGAESEAQRDMIHALVDQCLSSPHWVGRNGTLWRIAHAKIRPLAELKSGEDAGLIPLGDYEPDYALFIYGMSGDRDARDLLLADYYVAMTSEDPPRYERRAELEGQNAPPERRAGLLTSRWFLLINTMFTPLPRTTAAQAYRAFLGLDIAKSEGLIPPEGSTLVDYDDKGITDPACASCHTTLDPLSYPFSRYHGISGEVTGGYQVNRLDRFGPEEGARLSETPEAGAIFGVEVANLIEWAQVAAESDAFAQQITRDLWLALIGHLPRDAAESSEFEEVWRALRDRHQYRAERAIHDIIDTLAYGRP